MKKKNIAAYNNQNVPEFYSKFAQILTIIIIFTGKQMTILDSKLSWLLKNFQILTSLCQKTHSQWTDWWIQVFLWLINQIISDIFNESVYRDYARGNIKIILTIFAFYVFDRFSNLKKVIPRYNQGSGVILIFLLGASKVALLLLDSATRGKGELQQGRDLFRRDTMT